MPFAAATALHNKMEFESRFPYYLYPSSSTSDIENGLKPKILKNEKKNLKNVKIWVLGIAVIQSIVIASTAVISSLYCQCKI